MDGFSSIANTFAVISLAVQLASSIKKIYEFWDSVQQAPEEMHNMKADLELLSTALSEIALDVQQYQLKDSTLTTVLKQCAVKVGVLNALIDKIEPGFASKSCRVRKWSTVRAMFKDKKLKHFNVTLERLKTTLILVQQNHCSRLNRSQNQILENRLTDLCQGLSSLPLKWCSESVTLAANVPLESDQLLGPLRAEVSRVASSISNPVYRYAFERATSKTLNDIFSKTEIRSDSNSITRTSLPSEILAEANLERGLSNSLASKKDCLIHQYYISDHFFGTIHVEKKKFTLVSSQSDDLDACQYMHQTSFAFHPALWLIMLGLNFVIRFGYGGSYSRGWKYTIETARPVPDDALIFEFCREGYVAGVRNLLSNGQASVQDVDSRGRTPLYFAAENTLPKLCKLLIDSGADKGSRTYGPVNQSYSARSPIIAAAHKIRGSPGNKIEDCIEVFRLFEDCMDFSDGESDGWETLEALSQNAAAIPGCLVINMSTFLWALRYFLSDLRTNFDEDHLLSLLWFATFQQSEEAVDLLLGLSSNFIDFVERKDGYTVLLLRLSRDFLTNDPSTVLATNPNLHSLGMDLNISPHLESPTSLSLYSSWVFYSWRRHLILLGMNIEDFVRRELEHSALIDTGWTTETLLALFNYRNEADWVSDYDHRCSQCRRLSSIRVQPHWVQRVERIKHRIDPDGEPGRKVKSYNTSDKSDKIHNIRSTSSAESGADGRQHKAGVIEKDLDAQSRLFKAHTKRHKRDESSAFNEDLLENTPVTAELSILNCVYSKYLIVCIWCWEKHKENGYKWIDQHSYSGDNGRHDGDDYDNGYSPYLFYG